MGVKKALPVPEFLSINQVSRRPISLCLDRFLNFFLSPNLGQGPAYEPLAEASIDRGKGEDHRSLSEEARGDCVRIPSKNDAPCPETTFDLSENKSSKTAKFGSKRATPTRAKTAVE